MNDPDGLAGGTAGAAAAVSASGARAPALEGSAIDAAGVAGSGVTGEVPSGSARFRRIFGIGRVSAAGRRLSEEDGSLFVSCSAAAAASC